MSSRTTGSNANPLHAFWIVLPVAERPAQLSACLASLAELLSRHPYRGAIRVLVVEDSVSPAAIAAHAEEIARQRGQGFTIHHWLPQEQAALAAGLDLPTYFGTPSSGGHKGQAACRNLAYLWLARQDHPAPTLVWSIDSDQEFRVSAEGRTIDYFGLLDRLFHVTGVQVATGKVVGDPPVSPAVMTANLLADLLALLDRLAALTPEGSCAFHTNAQHTSEAAYHDHADLFGFTPPASCDYLCPIAGAHDNRAGFSEFCQRLGDFWQGAHPTRASSYQDIDFFASVQPARTVYAGNTVFRLATGPYPIPFAHLRLRMSGPTLGRLLKAELGTAFVAANFPLLHRRAGASPGFRPGVENRDGILDIGDEYERQFYGDVMLFTVERLAETVCRRPASADFAAELAVTHAEMMRRYAERRATIAERLESLAAWLASPPAPWAAMTEERQLLSRFAASVRYNFVAPAPGPTRIADRTRARDRLSRMATALAEYAEARARWQSLF